jgi:chorismate synthase
VRVAAGAIARKWLRQRYGVTVRGWMSRLGTIEIPWQDEAAIDANPFFVANAQIVSRLEDYMDALRKAGDSAGAEITVVGRGVPVGWGDPVYGRLDADIAYAMMGINAVKGVEIGAGFAAVTQKGSEHGDELTPNGFLGNNSGGILGGISTGQDVVVRMAVKPTSSIRLPRRTIDLAGSPTLIETHGRHDPCVGIRATPIAEAMLALVLIDAALHHRAQCADVVCPTPRIPARPIVK